MMQSMQKPAHAEQTGVKAQAICNREGQVLFMHAAPLGLSVGDDVTDRMTAAERRFFYALPSDADAICLCRTRVVLCQRRAFDGLLVRVCPLAASPAAVAAVEELCRALGLWLSPGITAKTGDMEGAEAASAELMRLCGFAAEPLRGGLTAKALLHQLAALPPLCTRQLSLDFAAGASLDGVWPVVLYCLAAFLCRSTDGSPLTMSVIGRPPMVTVLLSAGAPEKVPAGRSRLGILAERFPDAGELAICSALAARSGIEITISADGAGQLRIAAAQCPDPALLGLKQPVGFSDEAEAGEEAEWCRLLRAAVPAGR